MVIFIASAISCTSTRIDSEDPGSQSGKFYDTPLWSVAVKYPDGYDWMKDPLGGNVNTQILVFRDTSVMLRLDASPQGPICPESDHHSIVGGRLYSHFASEDGTTVMLVDGHEVFRFDGMESIDNIIVKGSDIYTMGVPLQTDGWSFRKNGELVFGQDSGQLVSPLYEDEGELCFSWASPILSSTGQKAWRYYSYFGGKRSQLATSSDITTVYCIRRHYGKVNYLAASSVIGGVVWENGEESFCISGTSGNLVEATFLLIGGSLHARMIERAWSEGISLWTESYWNKNVRVAQTDLLRQTCSITKDSPQLFFATSVWTGLTEIKLWKDGTEYSLPPKYFMVCPNSLCCNEKYHYVGLNDGGDAKKRPLLIHRGDTTKFNFNGYFTELSLP